jgi:hypothetical protein
MDVSYHSNTTSRIPFRGFRYIDNYKIFSPPTTDGYQVPFTLNYIQGGDPFFRDIQPVANGELLPYWIEDVEYYTAAITPFVSPKIWVRLPIGCKQVDIYRNNPKMAYNRSSGNRTFDFFDSFRGGYSALDTNKWTRTGGSITYGTQTKTVENPAYIKSNLTFGTGYGIRTNSITVGYTGYAQIAFEDGTTADGCGFYAHYPTANKYNTFSRTPAHTTGNDIGITAWTIVEINRNGSTSVDFKRDSTSLTSITTDISTNAKPVLLNAQAMDIISGWILVRKYQSPEPSYILQSTKTNPLWRG